MRRERKVKILCGDGTQQLVYIHELYLRGSKADVADGL